MMRRDLVSSKIEKLVAPLAFPVLFRARDIDSGTGYLRRKLPWRPQPAPTSRCQDRIPHFGAVAAPSPPPSSRTRGSIRPHRSGLQNRIDDPLTEKPLKNSGFFALATTDHGLQYPGRQLPSNRNQGNDFVAAPGTATLRDTSTADPPRLLSAMERSPNTPSGAAPEQGQVNAAGETPTVVLGEAHSPAFSIDSEQ